MQKKRQKIRSSLSITYARRGNKLEDARAFLLSSYLAPTFSQLLQHLIYLSLFLYMYIAGTLTACLC
jgi:hypothetical protein